MIKKILIISIFFMVSFRLWAQVPDFSYEIREVTIGNNELKLEVADDYYKRAYGLMYREELDFGKGMLFIHDKEEIQTYWMKNTFIDLAIFFINKDGIIVDIETMNAFDETPVPSKFPAIYAIEVPVQWYYFSNVSVGNEVNGIISEGRSNEK